MKKHTAQLREDQAEWSSQKSSLQKKPWFFRADLTHAFLTGVAVLISCIALIINIHERRETTKASATLTYARGFYAGLSANVLSKYVKYRSSLANVEEAGNILSPDEALMLYLYLEQALKCVEQGQCDSLLFCEYLGADMNTLLLHYEGDIREILELNYPKGNYFDHAYLSLESTCNEYWSARWAVRQSW